MDKVFAGIGLILITLFLVFIVAFLGGTILWLIWPLAIPLVFPGLVASGVIAGKLSWWTAVCFCWICGLLIKSSTSVSSNKSS